MYFWMQLFRTELFNQWRIDNRADATMQSFCAILVLMWPTTDKLKVAWLFPINRDMPKLDPVSNFVQAHYFLSARKPKFLDRKLQILVLCFANQRICIFMSQPFSEGFPFTSVSVGLPETNSEIWISFRPSCTINRKVWGPKMDTWTHFIKQLVCKHKFLQCIAFVTNSNHHCYAPNSVKKKHESPNS